MGSEPKAQVVKGIEDRITSVFEYAERCGLTIRVLEGKSLGPGEPVDLEELEVTCANCGSKRLEEWGESGTFWLHCHDCEQDGPDLPKFIARVSGLEIGDEE